MSRRLPALDGLRGMAALVVLVHHAMLISPGLASPYGTGPAAGDPWWLARTPLHVLWAGDEAVYVFFILSGFVLVAPHVGERARDLGWWVSYYPQRLLRLYVPVIASVALALLLVTLVPRQEITGLSSWWNGHAEPTTGEGLVRDLTLLAGNTWLNSPLWSLRWEVVFSLLLPVYVLAVRWTRRSWWLAPLGAVAAAAVGSTGVESLFYLSMFAIGAVAASRVTWLVERIAAAGPRWWSVMAVVSVALFEVSWLAPQHPVTSFASLTGAVLVFLLFLGAGPAIRLGTSAPAAWLGKVSFSLYLVHVPVLLLVGNVVDVREPMTASLVALGVGGPLSLLVAAAFHRVVEEPSHRLAQRTGRAVRTAVSRSATSGARSASAPDRGERSASPGDARAEESAGSATRAL